MSELKKKNDADLVSFIGEKREELRKLRFGIGNGTRNTRIVRTLRKELAQALTELGARNTNA